MSVSIQEDEGRPEANAFPGMSMILHQAHTSNAADGDGDSLL